MRKWTLFIGLLAIVWGSGLSAQDPKSTVPVLRAGAAAVDITPKEFPLNMPGGFSANMAESAHDPLHARALVLDDGAHDAGDGRGGQSGRGAGRARRSQGDRLEEDGHPRGQDARSAPRTRTPRR